MGRWLSHPLQYKHKNKYKQYVSLSLWCEYFVLGADFSFQPVLHDWCNKGRGMCNPVCGMVHIKEPLLLIRKSSPCGGSGFPLSLYVWYFTICLMSYNRKKNMFSVSLNKNISFLPSFLVLID